MGRGKGGDPRFERSEHEVALLKKGEEVGKASEMMNKTANCQLRLNKSDARPETT